MSGGRLHMHVSLGLDMQKSSARLFFSYRACLVLTLLCATAAKIEQDLSEVQ
jgi:hypothetical protein